MNAFKHLAQLAGNDDDVDADEVWKIVTAFDTDGDGKLSMDELEVFAKDIMGAPMSDKERKEIEEVAGEDGMLSKEEFIEASANM